MKSLSCKDLGIDCDFVARANDTPEVVASTYTHSVQEHTEIHEPMFADKAAALVAQMENAIREE
jgi:predicted small metal-binding protein